MSKDKLLILAPAHELDRTRPLWKVAGPGKFHCPGDTAFNDWVDAFVDHGVRFPFDVDQRLPHDLPEKLDGVRCLVLDPARRKEFSEGPVARRLEAFQRQGGRVVWPKAGPEFTDPKMDVFPLVQRVIEETGLKRQDLAMLARLRAMPDDRLMGWWKATLDDQRRVLQECDAGWAWGDPVGYHYYWPVFEAADYLKDPALLEPAWTFMRAGLDRSQWAGNLSCGKRFALKYYEHTRDRAVLERVKAEVNALLPVVRVPEGGVPEFVRKDNGWVNNETFANTCESIGSLSRLTGDPVYLEEAIRLGRFANRCCFVPSESLWLHRGHAQGPRPEESGFWGRGNGWFLYGVRGVLEDMPADHPARGEFLAMLQAGLEGLARHQRADGLWGNVVTASEAESRSDCCGAWMYTAVFGRAWWKGWLRDERIPGMLEKAWQGLKGKTWRGLPISQCCGTGYSTPHAAYYQRAHTKFHGLPLMHALVELWRAQGRMP
jgi:rhamnogalacturonyl hydrolase YesR